MFRAVWYEIILNLVRYGFFWATGGLKRVGTKNVPRKGPLIVAPNHSSDLDPPVVAVCIPRHLAFMAKEEMFRNRFFGGLIRSLGAFPIKRGEGDSEAVRTAMRLLSEGRAVIMFPEGTRGDGITMLPLNKGVGLIAKRTGAPVVPVAIVGTHKKWPRGKKLPGWGRVTVAFGEPFTYASVASSDKEPENREIFAQELARRILALCNENGYPLRTCASETGSKGSAEDESATEPQAPATP